MPRSLVALSLLCAAFAPAARADSFNSVRARVYAAPSQTLPMYPGLSMSEFAKAFAGLKEPIGTRATQTLSIQSDFKPRAAKLLHPRGVCAEALWVINKDSPATGLLAKGTSIPAIIRLSAANGESSYIKSNTRIFGMAIKLFPTKDGAKEVKTRNMFTLDQGGLEGTNRMTFYGQAGQGVFFHNFAPGKGLGSKVANSFFSRFDQPADVRPLWPLTEIDQSGNKVAQPRTPAEIRFVPVRAPGAGEKAADDFRDELMQYKTGQISFAIDMMDASGKFTQIGSLFVGAPVVSPTCDLELHFHHHPHKRGLERQ